MASIDQYFDDVVFEKRDFSIEEFKIGEYDDCRFNQCNFESLHFSTTRFSECIFSGCNFSLAVLKGTAFQSVQFVDCKILGVHFEDSSPFLFSAGFKNCTTDHTSFTGMKLKDTVFDNCHMKGADFSNADLSSAKFDLCDLSDAVFSQTILEKTDFSTAYSFRIDPEQNRMKKAKFSSGGLPGLLEKYHLDIIP